MNSIQNKLPIFLLAAIFLALLCQVVLSVPLWGSIGHAMTASIAQTYLSAASQKEAQYFLPSAKGQLSSIASWADQIRSDKAYSWSGPLHYINTPDWECDFTPSSDCKDDFCVSGAIYNYTDQLADDGLSEDERLVALKFVVHYIGDIHQPMHVGFASDKGGNSLHGKYYGNTYNLHSIWDSQILYSRINEFGDEDEYQQFIINKMSNEWSDMVTTWGTCNGTSSADTSYACPDEWAVETAAIACTYGYTDENGDKIENNFSVGEDYYQFVKDAIDLQVAKGAIRLAVTLNNIWGN